MVKKIKNISKGFFTSPILLILAGSLIVRLILSPFGTLNLDQGTFIGWSHKLLREGFSTFYNSWSDYLPGYMYVLWVLGQIDKLNIFPQEILFKLPAILSDLITGGLIYLILRKIVREKTALLASAIYLFNPAVWANSTLWGQVDSLTAFFSLASIYLAGVSPIASSIFLAIGTLIKPQAALAAGIVFFIMIRDKWPLKKIVLYVITGLAFFVIAFIPFTGGNNVVEFIYQRILLTLNQYPYSSVNAFSFWGFFGFWKPEGKGLLSANIIGMILTLAIYIYGFLKLQKIKLAEYKFAALLFLGSFLFFSRMHERHMLFALAPLAVAGSLNPLLWISYAGISVTYLANLYYSYIWITQQFTEIISQTFIKFFIIANILIFILMIKESVKRFATKLNIKLNNSFWRKRKLNDNFSFPKLNIPARWVKILLAIILGFSLLSRLLFLNHPEKEYFDEVYHAFTSRILLHGDPKAWEWWNPHPEGFAYEWTHPPLAKEGMVLGMMIFGENSFGWRFPGALLGVGTVLLIYLIAKTLFKDEGIGLLSAAVFSLDGLPLVMSRIAMNDSYLLFFILLSLYLYIKDKNLLSAVSFGLAVSSKWSAVWAVPIFFLIHFVLNKKFKLSYFWFLILPPLVYVASYIPMFTSGHDFEVFIGMQKQMWWYHTRLKATHPYTSMWYTWPLLIRPIWLYTASVKEKVENIYAMGNPIVFWTGFASVITALYYAFKERCRILALIVFSYLIFFVPWAASPRIMFFYHYLPSVPFLAIATGYVLRKNLKWVTAFVFLGIITFIYFYPHWTGMSVSKILDLSYYWFDSWR